MYFAPVWVAKSSFSVCDQGVYFLGVYFLTEYLCVFPTDSQCDQSSTNKKAGRDGSRNHLPAYALLEGPYVLCYMRSVCLTLGRCKEEEVGQKRKASQGKGCDDDDDPQAFVGLGRASTISRKHLQIVFDFLKR